MTAIETAFAKATRNRTICSWSGVAAFDSVSGDARQPCAGRTLRVTVSLQDRERREPALPARDRPRGGLPKMVVRDNLG
jgi:hypothetical protein